MMMYYVCDNNGGVQIFFHRFDVCFMFCLSNFWWQWHCREGYKQHIELDELALKEVVFYFFLISKVFFYQFLCLMVKRESK